MICIKACSGEVMSTRLLRGNHFPAIARQFGETKKAFSYQEILECTFFLQLHFFFILGFGESSQWLRAIVSLKKTNSGLIPTSYTKTS